MPPRKSLFSNKYVIATAKDGESNAVGSYKELNIKFKLGKEDSFVIKMSEDGRGIVVNNGGEQTCDERNLAIALTETLFEQKPRQLEFGKYNEYVVLPQGMADWLLQAGGEFVEDMYVVVDDAIYDLTAVQQVYIHKLEKYNETVASDDAVEANKVLIRIARNTEDIGRKQFINCDLHFVDDRYANKYIDEKGYPFHHIAPLYSCSRDQIAGLLKHALNYMKKVERESPKFVHREIAAEMKLQDCFDDVRYSEDGCFVRNGRYQHRIVTMGDGRVSVGVDLGNGEIEEVYMPYKIDMIVKILSDDKRLFN